jgi:hypothetical protein
MRSLPGECLKTPAKKQLRGKNPQVEWNYGKNFFFTQEREKGGVQK